MGPRRARGRSMQRKERRRKEKAGPGEENRAKYIKYARKDMVFFFYSISSGGALCSHGRSPPFQGGGGERGDNLRFKDCKKIVDGPLSPHHPHGRSPEKMC